MCSEHQLYGLKPSISLNQHFNQIFPNYSIMVIIFICEPVVAHNYLAPLNSLFQSRDHLAAILGNVSPCLATVIRQEIGSSPLLSQSSPVVHPSPAMCTEVAKHKVEENWRWKSIYVASLLPFTPWTQLSVGSWDTCVFFCNSFCFSAHHHE